MQSALDEAPFQRPRGETSRALRRAVEALAEEQPTLGQLVDALGRSGHALVLLLLALPAFIPIPGLPVGLVFGTALSIVSLQLLRGGEALWLPHWLRRQNLPRRALLATVLRLDDWMARIERLLRPRLPALTEGSGVALVAALVFVMGLTIILPIPTGNQGPAFAVVVFAFGLLERDGVAILAGVALSIVGFAWNVAIVLFGAVLTQRLWELWS